MAQCKECGALLPPDYFLLEKCNHCIDNPSDVEYTDDINLYSFMEDDEDD